MKEYTVRTLATDIPMLTKAADAFLMDIKRKELSDETFRGYQGDLKQFNKFLLGTSNIPVFLEQCTEEKIEEFIEELKSKGLKPASINRKLHAISSFCNFAVKKRWLSYNPALDVDSVKGKSKERIFLSVLEMQQLVEAIEQPIIKTVAILMSNTGLRVSEATNLQLKDVDFVNRVIHVIEGKGGKDRDVPMSEALANILQIYLETIRPNVKSLFFFATKRTGGISQQYINRELKKTCKKINLGKEVTSHIFRHSFASQLVKSDTHVSHIQRLLGHADVRTTSVYMHAEYRDLADAVNSINFIKDAIK